MPPCWKAAGFAGSWGPTYIWKAYHFLLAEAERITYENAPVTPEDAKELRDWYGRPSS